MEPQLLELIRHNLQDNILVEHHRGSITHLRRSNPEAWAKGKKVSEALAMTVKVEVSGAFLAVVVVDFSRRFLSGLEKVCER